MTKQLRFLLLAALLALHMASAETFIVGSFRQIDCDGECLAVRGDEVWAGSRGDGLWRSTALGATGSSEKVGGPAFDALRTWVVHPLAQKLSLLLTLGR